MTSQFYLEPPLVERTHVYAPNPTEDIVLMKVVVFDAKDLLAHPQQQIVNKDRHATLLGYRNFTGIFALVLLVVLAAFPFFGLPYEPIMALLLAVAGTFVVFVMKVADAA